MQSKSCCSRGTKLRWRLVMHVYSLHALRHRRRRFLGDGGSLSTRLRKLESEPSKVHTNSGPTESWALSWASLASHSARLRSACSQVWRNPADTCARINFRLALGQGTLMVSK